MNNDKDSLSSLIISEENKISFIESKPYADLSSSVYDTNVLDDTISIVDDAEEEIEEKLPLENLFTNFSLVEAGTSVVVCKGKISDVSNSIEYIGNGKYRAYIDEDVKQGMVRNSSPGYFITEVAQHNKIEKHGIKIGYNSGKNYQSINRISHDSSLIQTKHCWCDTDGFVNIVCEQKHGLKQNSLVELKDSIFTGLYDVIYCNDHIFKVSHENATENSIIPPPSFISHTGTKVYCNVSSVNVGDRVVFDYANGKGKSYIIDAIRKDSFGVYFHVDCILNKNCKKFIVSHFLEEANSVVEFGYETNLSYYNVAKVNPKTHNLWLTYTPDVKPNGRKNEKVSYIEFYSSSIFKYGI